MPGTFLEVSPLRHLSGLNLAEAFQVFPLPKEKSPAFLPSRASLEAMAVLVTFVVQIGKAKCGSRDEDAISL